MRGWYRERRPVRGDEPSGARHDTIPVVPRSVPMMIVEDGDGYRLIEVPTT